MASPPASPRERRGFVEFLRVEQVGGLVLLAAAALALVAANSPLGDAYDDLLHTQLGPLDVAHWAADGLLTIFFFVAGLELKRELVVGELSNPRTAALPAVAALGGMVVPALVYVAVAGPIEGWAVPTATDIAFALGVLAVVGSHAPAGLRLFLLSLAVVDDLGAIALIAVLFTDDLSLLWLLGSAALLAVFSLMQRARITTAWLVVPLAVATWWAVHESGVHATVAGIGMGLLTRVRRDDGEDEAPAERWEHAVQPWSAGLVVPIFAFTAAGVAVDLDALRDVVTEPIALGVALGLVVGKPLGIVGASWIAVRLGLASLPPRVGWGDVLGLGLLAGCGFTVSLLVARLSFDDPEGVVLAVLVASMVASVAGAVAIRLRKAAHVGEPDVC